MGRGSSRITRGRSNDPLSHRIFSSQFGLFSAGHSASDRQRPQIVSSKPPGTTFIFTPGTYRLSESIIPKDNDKFVGETSCAPPASSCPAIISGGVEIGSSATQQRGSYAVAKQKQQVPAATLKSVIPVGTAATIRRTCFSMACPTSTWSLYPASPRLRRVVV